MHLACLVTVAALTPAAAAQGGGPSGKFEVVSPKPAGIVATGINDRGDVIGFEWIEEEERPGVVEQVPFYARAREITYLPLLEGYTSTFPAAVSDGGLVVGRVSKPIDPTVRVPMPNQAFAWDAEGGIRGLGVLEGDTASFATGISADGRRIAGFSVGEGRVRACVWDREGDGWRGVALPQQDRLGSNVVALSDDGKRAAAVDGVVPCLWSEDASGGWTREVIGEPGSLVPRAVNDDGMVVGVRFGGDGMNHAVAWSRDGGVQLLEEPEGYVHSEANDVNNAGAVVGIVDGPRGSDVGPHAFVSEGGRLRLIVEGGPGFTAATAINDRGQVAGILEDLEDEEPADQPR